VAPEVVVEAKAFHCKQIFNTSDKDLEMYKKHLHNNAFSKPTNA